MLRAALLSVVFVLAGCAGLTRKAEAPMVGLSNIQLSQMTLFEQRYTLQLRVQNPNDFDLPVKGMHCTLFINGREFASGVSAAAVTVPRFGEAMLDVDVVSDLRRVFEQLRDAGATESISYRLSGKLSVDGYAFSLPFDYRGEFDFKALPAPR